MSNLAIPTVHMNGTSKAELVEQLREAARAIRTAKDALAMSAPHGRDYYTQSDPSAIGKATREYAARQLKLAEVYSELEEIAIAVQNQGR
jgi:hypothetical protein